MSGRVDVRRRAAVAARHHGWARGRVRSLDIRSGDTVVVIAGKDKGKRGVVERTLPSEQRIVVRGVNLLKRHTKAGVKGNMQGGIVDFDAPVAYSNVMLVCPNCDRATRVGHERMDEGRGVLVCRKCGERYERPRG